MLDNGETIARRSYTIENRTLGDALCTILNQAHENYLVCLPATDKSITINLAQPMCAKRGRVATYL